MAEVFKLNRSNKKRVEWRVEIDGVEYSLPLGNSMTTQVVEKLQKRTYTDLCDVLRMYIPAEVVATFDVDDITALINGWNEAAQRLQGASLGESQASRGS